MKMHFVHLHIFACGWSRSDAFGVHVCLYDHYYQHTFCMIFGSRQTLCEEKCTSVLFSWICLTMCLISLN